MGATQGKDFPYEVLDVVQAFEGKSLWKLQNGAKKVDKTPVSIFSFDLKKNAHKASVANNTFKRAKTLRHPNVITYLDGIELPDTINIVTEELVPLESVIEEARKYPNSLSWGLHQVTKALAFLNNDCNLIHGNLTLSSVFVNKAGDWKLGGLDLVSAHKDPAGVIRSQFDSLPQQYRPPELQKSSWNLIDEASPWAVDSWLLACFIYEVYNGKLNKTEDLKTIGKIPKILQDSYKALLHSNPKGRLNTQEVLESDYFQNPYVETCQFLETIALKEPHEKDKFFKNLEKQLDADEFPAALCKYKILPQLVIALDYGSANSRVLGPLLKIGKSLTTDEYNVQIIPSIVKWFGSQDVNLKMNLLQNLEHFIEYLSSAVVNDQIFPNVATGFDNPSPIIRELTVRAMLQIVPKLNERTVNTHMLKLLAKSQMDPEYGIRTNTTVLLAKIAVYLSASTRQKILAAAFCRALKDPHPKARVAGVMGLEHTLNYYTKEDCATKVIPTLAVTLIDPEKEARDGAFRVIRMFVDKLDKISETGIDENADQAPKNEGMLGWAWGAMSKKIYGEGQAPSPQQQTMQPKSDVSNDVKPPVKKNPSAELDGWDNDEFDALDKDNDDDFSSTVYTSKKPPTKSYEEKKDIFPSKSGSSTSLPQKKELPKTAPSKPATNVVDKWSDDEKGGWDNVDDIASDEDNQVYGSKPKSKFQMDEEEEEPSDGWDNEDWDFDDKASKSSKLDMAKQKQQEKTKRTGKAD